MRTYSVPALLITSSLLCLTGNGFAANGGPDAYGYTWADAGGSINHHWIDITATGEEVLWDGDDTSSNDAGSGIGSPVGLGFPVTLYGTTYTQLVPTANGYLSSDPAEAGLDNSNDCLPAAPDKGGGVRLYAFHDDLSLTGASARVLYQHFEVSPHPDKHGGVSVFSWENARIEGGADAGRSISFQALLFHDGDIYVQYDTFGFSLGAGATVGLQSETATNGLQYICNSNAIGPDQNVRFRPPTVRVDTFLDELNPLSPTSFRDALDTVPPGGRIEFISTNYTHSWRLSLPDTIVIDKPVSIVGPYLNDSNSGLLYFEPLETRFLIDGVPVHIEKTRMLNPPGRALEVANGGALSLCRSEILGYQDTGLFVEDGGDAHLADSIIHAGALESRSAIEVEGDSRLVLTDSAVLGSREEAILFNGVKVPSYSPNLVLDRSSVVLNHDDALRAETADIRVVNSTFSENAGTAILLSDASADIRHSTIVNNLEGLRIEGGTSVDVSHTIVAHNAGFDQLSANTVIDGSSTLTSLGHNLSDDTGTPWTGTGDLTGDPGLMPLGLHEGPLHFCHLLEHGSIGIDAGGLPGGDTPETDQRGRDRVTDGDGTVTELLDIGAVEMSPFIMVNTLANETDIPPGSDVSLYEALQSVSPETGRVVIAASLNGGVVTNVGPVGGTTVVDASMLADGLILEGDGFHSAALALHNMTIRGSDRSAARYAGLNPLTLTECVIQGNTSSGSPLGNDHGGGVYSEGNLFVNQCRFVGNSVDAATLRNGGGLALTRPKQLDVPTDPTGPSNYKAGNTYLLDTVFEANNSSSLGGALWANKPARLLVRGCTFHDNSEGAVYLELGTYSAAEFIGCAFIENDATVDGIAAAVIGMANGETNANVLAVPVHYSTFHANRAVEFSGSGIGGGALLADSTDVDVHRATMTQNSAAGGGAIGVYATGGISAATVRVRGSIITRNAAWAQPDILTPDQLDVGPGGALLSGGYNYVAPDAAGVFTNATDTTGTAPGLSPVGRYGGPTPSRHPYATSPMIDAGPILLERVLDQRGLYSKEGAATDIGAVEAGPTVLVDTAKDEFDTPSGANRSLREAIRDAHPGDRIVFDIFGFNTNPEIDLDPSDMGQGTSLFIDKSLVIDATDMPMGVPIAGASTSRVMEIVGEETDVALFGLSLKDGQSAGTTGGGLRVGDADVTLTHAAIHDNVSGTSGGGILLSSARLLLENVTVFGNVAGDRGGAIFAFGGSELDVRHSTLFQNESANGAAGVHLFSTDWALENSVVAENLRTGNPALGPQNSFFGAGSALLSGGHNITDGSFLTAASDLNNTPPFLLTLTDAGGPALTVPPDAFSPMLDNGPGTFDDLPETDARGFPRPFGAAGDTGAFELGPMGPNSDSDNDGMDDYWEHYYGLIVGVDDAGGNGDGDVYTHIEEYQNETDPTSFDPEPFSIEIVEFAPGPSQPDELRVRFTTTPGVDYWLWYNADPGTTNWIKFVFFPGENILSTQQIFNMSHTLYGGPLDAVLFRVTSP